MMRRLIAALLVGLPALAGAGTYVTGGSATDKIPSRAPPVGTDVRTIVRASDLNDLKRHTEGWYNVKSSAYGAKGDLSVADDGAVLAAANAAGAAGGGTVFLPPGDYRFDAPVDIAYSNVRIVGAGMGRTRVVMASTMTGSTAHAFRFWNQTVGTSRTLTLSAAVGDNWVNVSASDAASFAVGDYVLVRALKIADPESGGKFIGEIHRIQSLNATVGVLDLEDALSDTYTVADQASVLKVSVLENVGMSDLAISHAAVSAPSISTPAITCRNCRNALFERVYIHDVFHTAIDLWSSLDSTVADCRIEDVRSSTSATMYYGVWVASASRNITLRGNHFSRMRHSTTTGTHSNPSVQSVTISSYTPGTTSMTLSATPSSALVGDTIMQGVGSPSLQVNAIITTISGSTLTLDRSTSAFVAGSATIYRASTDGVEGVQRGVLVEGNTSYASTTGHYDSHAPAEGVSFIGNSAYGAWPEGSPASLAPANWLGRVNCIQTRADKTIIANNLCQYAHEGIMLFNVEAKDVVISNNVIRDLTSPHFTSQLTSSISADAATLTVRDARGYSTASRNCADNATGLCVTIGSAKVDCTAVNTGTNQITGCATGLPASSIGTPVTQWTSGGEGIYFDSAMRGSGILVTGNVIVRTDHSCISSGGNQNQISVVNNICKQNALRWSRAAIRIANGNRMDVSGNRIEDMGGTSAPIDLSSGGDNHRVANNYLYNNVSTTITVPGVNSIVKDNFGVPVVTAGVTGFAGSLAIPIAPATDIAPGISPAGQAGLDDSVTYTFTAPGTVLLRKGVVHEVFFRNQSWLLPGGSYLGSWTGYSCAYPLCASRVESLIHVVPGDTIKVVYVTSDAAWTTNTALELGRNRRPVAGDNGHRYQVIVAGTTHATDEPTWKTDGTTFTDGTVTWKDEGVRQPEISIWWD